MAEINVPARRSEEPGGYLGEIVECREGQLIEITEAFIEGTGGEIRFKLIDEDGMSPFTDLWVYRYDGTMALMPLEEVTLDEAENILTAQISKEGVYVLYNKNSSLEDPEITTESVENSPQESSPEITDYESNVFGETNIQLTSTTATGVVKLGDPNSSLNVRKTASPTGEKIGSVNHNQNVTIVGSMWLIDKQ